MSAKYIPSAGYLLSDYAYPRSAQHNLIQYLIALQIAYTTDKLSSTYRVGFRSDSELVTLSQVVNYKSSIKIIPVVEGLYMSNYDGIRYYLKLDSILVNNGLNVNTTIITADTNLVFNITYSLIIYD